MPKGSALASGNDKRLDKKQKQHQPPPTANANK